MTTTFIVLLVVAVIVDVVTLAVIGFSLHQAITNLTALRALNMKNGRTIVARALIRRTVIQGLVVIGLATVSTVRIWQIYNGSNPNLLLVSTLFTVQILVAASAIYDVIERVHVIRWYDDNPGAREYEARVIEDGGVNPEHPGVE